MPRKTHPRKRNQKAKGLKRPRSWHRSHTSKGQIVPIWAQKQAA